MSTKADQLLCVIENTGLLLEKAQINFKKCPAKRLTKGYIETRITTIEEYWATLNSAHQELVKFVPKEKHGDLDYFANEEYFRYEELYLCLHADLKDLLSSVTLTKTKECAATSVESHVKLPRIQLPIFTGLYEEWPAFHDLFVSLVHNNPTLSNVQKLHYLKSSLRGEAEALIRHIQVTESNYRQAWEKLKARYGNKKFIVNSLLKKLFSQKKIPSQTANHIKSLLDTTNECLHCLENLNISTDSWDPVIIFLIVQKLDPESHREWEEVAYKDDSEELPKWEDLAKFLEKKYRKEELVNEPSKEKSTKSKEYTVHASTSETSTATPRCCKMCNENHTLCHCKEFTKMDPTQRCEYVKSNHLCFNCLSPGHSAKKCRLAMSCRVCHKRHHSLVHQTAPTTTSKPDSMQAHHSNVDDQETSVHTNESNEEFSSHYTTNKSTALLATALVPVRDERGHTTILRALVDNGSQATFISERAAQALKLKRKSVQGTITGVGSTKTEVKQATHIELLSRHDDTFKLKIRAYIMPTPLTKQLPSKTISANTWPHLEGLLLADPRFHQPGRVDMLLGVEVCAQILRCEVIKGPPGTPCAQNTSLGWILFGNIQVEKKQRDDIVVMHHNLDLDEMLKTMWELDKAETRVLTADEKKCEEIYQATHSRTDEGRYIVKMPMKTEHLLSTQGETKEIASRKLLQLERRFERNKGLKEEYVKVMDEYLEMNHMEEVPKEDIDKPAVYLPHHAIVKEEKETTKVRVVYNASEKGKNDVSLNDELLVGPQLQEDMRSLIMKWRLKKVCFVADIQKMYRMIMVTKEDKDLQRLVWRRNTNEPIKDYRLTRVTFGTASAPYLAVKTLHQVAEDEGKDNPEAVKVIKEHFYMDDLMAGHDDLSSAISIAKQVEDILKKGGFILQKWCSNNVEFLKQFEPSKRSTHVNMDITIDGTIRALGLQWNMGKDAFQYSLTLPPVAETITKRTILADTQRLFDPLGWLSPSILPAKLLIQRLWLEGVSWDEEVDAMIAEEWIRLRDELQQNLDGIEIQRWLQTTEQSMKNVTVHGFCDASTKAYASVAYLRNENEDGEVQTGIIAAKTRVAPVKSVSLPRLELCGAVLLSKMLKQIKEALHLSASQIYGWTDSTIVLSWLFGDPGRWNTFVRNRVVEILDNIGNNWYHVQTQDNPADAASRGKDLSELKDDELWWKGPEWLRKEIKYSRPNNININLERKETIQTHLTTETEEKSIAKQFGEFESLKELLKTITYCRRFLKGKEEQHKDKTMTTKELDDSLKTCVKIEQKNSFEKEINSLKTKKQVRKDSKLKSLQPYLDEEDILRVGGRLQNANMNEDSKHPMILESNNDLAALIVADAHLRTMHGGVQLMLGYLRTKFWILKAKSLVKAKIHKCLICAKQNATSKNQLMGNLPSVRVNPSRPFLHSGVDFAGPFQILMSKGRGAKTNKAYVSLFVCMSTKAIHLELVGDLTSDSFIGAFNRFVARRGRCAHLWSDQGRNFVGANKELAAAWREAKLEFEGQIAESLALDGTQWHFIPAYSPHMGGLWEAGVKSLKHHLKRILTSHLTFEEMTTILCQIEACLNSRPLSPTEDADTDEIIPLTPGHFLIGEAPIAVPSPDLKHIKVNQLTRWQHTQRLLADLWHRWQQEYLSRLQQRPKWHQKIKELDIGHIVLIKTDNLPPGKWLLGRIVDKHPGPDGVTRVYSVKSGDSVVKRSFNKLCLLPIDIED